MVKICMHRLKKTLISWRGFAALVICAAVVVLCDMPLYEFSREVGASLGIMEGFIYFASDEIMLTVVVAAILFLVSDSPFTGSDEVYTVLRTSKRKWIIGNMLFVVVLCTVIYLFLIMVSMIYIADNAYMANLWSDVIYYLANGMNFGDNTIYFPYIDLLNRTPFECVCISILLGVGYASVLGLLLMWINLVTNKVIGYLPVMLFHAFGYMLALQTLAQKLGKLSLFGNSVLVNLARKGSKSEYNFTVQQSLTIFLILLLLIIVFNIFAVKKYDFNTIK